MMVAEEFVLQAPLAALVVACYVKKKKKGSDAIIVIFAVTNDYLLQ